MTNNEEGLTILEYIDKIKNNEIVVKNPSIVNIKSSDECTKEEILNYASWLNQEHHKIMNNKKFTSDSDELVKCLTCQYAKVNKNNLMLNGDNKYIIICKKETLCFETAWNSHISDLPCWRCKDDNYF